MPALDLPTDVEAVFRHFRTCEFTTVNSKGQPLTWPTEPFLLKEEGQLVVTSSIAFAVKAYNARRDSRVALLLSDPTGSGLSDPPAVLVQGDATVRELVDDPPWTYEMFRESITRQPNTRRFISSRVVQRLFEFQFQRIAIILDPGAILAWSRGDFSSAPARIVDRPSGRADEVRGDPAPSAPETNENAADATESAWNVDLVKRALAYPTAVLTVVTQDGYPYSVRVKPEFDGARREIALRPAPTLPDGAARKVCLLLHRHDEHLGKQHEMLIKGQLLTGDGTQRIRPTGFLTGSGSSKTDRLPVSGSAWERTQFMLLGRRRAREYIAKRGEPWPPRPWKKMLRYLDEGPGSLPEPER